MVKQHPAANSDGVLNSNDPVGRRIGSKFTPQQLLTQCSGIRRYSLTPDLLVDRIYRASEEVSHV